MPFKCTIPSLKGNSMENAHFLAAYKIKEIASHCYMWKTNTRENIYHIELQKAWGVVFLIHTICDTIQGKIPILSLRRRREKLPPIYTPAKSIQGRIPITLNNRSREGLSFLFVFYALQFKGKHPVFRREKLPPISISVTSRRITYLIDS